MQSFGSKFLPFVVSVLLLFGRAMAGKTVTVVTTTANQTTVTTTDPYAELWAVTALMALVGACIAIAAVICGVSWFLTYAEYQQIEFDYPKDMDFAYLLINDALNRR